MKRFGIAAAVFCLVSSILVWPLPAGAKPPTPTPAPTTTPLPTQTPTPTPTAVPWTPQVIDSTGKVVGVLDAGNIVYLNLGGEYVITSGWTKSGPGGRGLGAFFYESDDCSSTPYLPALNELLQTPSFDGTVFTLRVGPTLTRTIAAYLDGSYTCVPLNPPEEMAVRAVGTIDFPFTPPFHIGQ